MLTAGIYFNLLRLSKEVSLTIIFQKKKSLHISEFFLLNGHLKVEPWLSSFIIDYAIYKGKYDEALLYLQKINEPALLLQKYINISNILCLKKDYSVSVCFFKHIVRNVKKIFIIDLLYLVLF